jgi:hypothetical protein
LPARYEIATEQEMKLYPPEAFLARFPTSYGALTFSRVAFNRDLTEAFFYTEHLSGFCGEGKYVYMQKTGGKWVVARFLREGESPPLNEWLPHIFCMIGAPTNLYGRQSDPAALHLGIAV